MDVDRFNFWQTLPTVLEAISLADYVAFDLEMSGIPNSVGTSQPTEPAFYHLAAEAARTFQILQVGLTCLSYNSKHKEYRARTFTFELTPEFFPPNTALAKLIDRKLVLSYRSFLFLKENNFSFEKTFSQGVPYLSRSEGAIANGLYLAKPKYRNAVGKETRWQKSWDNEYKKRHDSVVRQTGFRYIIEALVGGSFAEALDPELLLDNNHLPFATSRQSAASQLRRNLHLYEARLQTYRPILIGHNPFLDLCFLHQTFLQPLPADAPSFRRATHRFFPGIIDTKQLACQLGWKPSRNLAQLYGDLVGRDDNHDQPRHHTQHSQHHHSHQPPPPPLPITPEPGFDPRERGAAHNAGFDSWMTAAVFVALSGQTLTGSSGVGPLSPAPPSPPAVLRGLRGDNGVKAVREGEGVGGRMEMMVSRKGDELFRELCPFGGGRSEVSGKSEVGKGAVERPRPMWDGEVWRKYGNKLRMGTAGIMDLAG